MPPTQLSVHHPMGYPPKVTPKAMAPRLETLEGKKVFLLDCRFDDADIFLKQMQDWFLEHMPGVQAELIRLNSVYTRDDPETWEYIKANGHAAIVGVGHWSTCAPAVAVHAMTIDHKYQVPTVAVHTNVFERTVRSVARVNGMPRTRAVFVPQPVMGKTPKELRAYVDGNDPTTGRPVMQEVIEGLTRPFDAQDLEKVAYERSTPRLVEPATEDELHQLFLENDWTDKLPIILPTEERVAAMLEHTSRKPDEVVGHMRPTLFREFWEYTVEKVAVNAVMAGAKPEYFPVILAIAASGISGRGSSTSSPSGMVVVNGPVRQELDMNWGTGALGPYNHANATIGRAYSLLSQNLQGGSQPGVTYMGSQGNNYAYNCITFAENEERSPWEPLHVSHGFKASDSAVSVFSGVRHTAFTLGLREAHWQDHVRSMLRGMDPREHPTFVLDPITARLFIDRGGFDTKDKLIDWIQNNACMPAGEYWDYQLIQNYIYPRATYGEEPYASMLRADPDELVHMFQKHEINVVVVVGGETNGYWRIFGASYGKTVSVDDWR